MKFIHTSDWHLGKKLHEHSLIEDQFYILNELLHIVDDCKPDAIVIAGDVYDSRVPPSDAVDLCDEILTKLLLEKNVSVLCISGNHDSGARLNFGSKLFEKNNFFMRAQTDPNADPIILDDEYGKIYFSLIPYFYPSKVREKFNMDDDAKSISYDDAAQTVINAARCKIPNNKRSIAVAHLFITGSIRSDSEDEMIGGIDAINPEHFADYNYVALGHLHQRQSKFADKIRYSGSLLKYSFGEENHIKGVDIVTIDERGNIKVKQEPLQPKRDVRTITGFMDDILENEHNSDDYVLVRLKDEQPLNAGERLRKLYPNLLGVENISEKFDVETSKLQDREGLSDAELFGVFFREMTGRKMNEDEFKAFMECMKDLGNL